MVVTATGPARSIGYVPDRTAGGRTTGRHQRETLTKRRAVDFCRVATALCPAPPGVGQPVARPRGVLG
jgi:hypothetical protein